MVLTGSAGAGKTKLVSSIVDHFLQLHDTTKRHDLDDEKDLPSGPLDALKIMLPERPTIPDTSFAFFYCRRTQEERRSPENVLCSYLKQLALAHEKALALLRGKYLEKKRGGFLSNTLGLVEGQELLAKMVKLRSQTILVLDALDECREDSRHNLITVLNELIDRGLKVKVIISSRRDDDITAEFEDKINFNISATDNGGDIMSFVRGKIEQYRNSRTMKRRINSVISKELEQKIIDVFLDKSNGMQVFLYIELWDID
jgi:hypothetical protein